MKELPFAGDVNWGLPDVNSFEKAESRWERVAAAKEMASVASAPSMKQHFEELPLLGEGDCRVQTMGGARAGSHPTL